MKTRFFVSRESRWAGTPIRRYFLRYLYPEIESQGVPEEPDAVADLLYDVALSTIPQEFAFTHDEKDATPRSVQWSDEGIEIQVDDSSRYLNVGDVVDMEINVVGQAKLS